MVSVACDQTTNRVHSTTTCVSLKTRFALSPGVLVLADSTSALLRDTTGDLIRDGANRATIRIDLREGANSCRVTTTFAKSGGGFEIVKRQVTTRNRSYMLS